MTSHQAVLPLIAVLMLSGIARPAAANDVLETRIFNSSPDLVWNAWSDPELLSQWWGPTGFTAPKVEVNFDVGSSTLVCMQAEGTPLMCNTWTYTAIEWDTELRFDSRFASEDGTAMAATATGLPPGIPDVVPHRITFESTETGGTLMTVHETGYTTPEAAALSTQGLVQVLDKMQALVP